MSHEDRAGLLSPKNNPTITISSIHTPQSVHHSRHGRDYAASEDLAPIDETREEDFETSRFVRRNLSVTDPQVESSNASPSILRRISTKLLSPASSASRRSTKKSKGKGYENLDDSDADFVAVDLSSLGGLGIEISEPEVSPVESLTAQDTSYQGTNVTPEKPDFNEFRKRRTLGAGMVIGAQLKRDLSQLNRNSAGATSSSDQNEMQRTKTVRDIGQNLAEQRKVIVAVSEAVDISSLDGASVKHNRGPTFDNIAVPRGSTLLDNPQSYFFPSDPEIPNWRPFSMRKPYIIMLILVALGLAGFQEYLCQLSYKKQNEKPPTGILAFNEVAEVSTWDFFLWKYLPTMITIIYAVAFSIMDFDIRRLEPYYQLSQPNGSPASASLNLDHLTMFQYFVPFKAMRLKQWAVFASTFANILAATIAPALQNPSVAFTQNPDVRCFKDDQCPNNAMRFWVRISPVWSRLLSTTYIIIALIGVFLSFQLRRKSGLLSDPKGIAGIASMATKSHILQDFKGLDLATRGEIHRRLAHRRYLLYKSSIWQGEWSPSSEPPQEGARRLGSPHPIMLRMTAGIPFIVVLILCLLAVPLISLTPARAVPNGAPWLPIFVATVIKLVWTTFEADVRLMEPFYQLSRGNARPESSLTLDYQSTVYGWMPIRASLNGHWLVALVGLASVCLDILSVTVSSFSVSSNVFLKHETRGENTSNQDETYISFWASVTLSITILVFVIFTATLVYIRRRHPFLPREPSTIAAVLSFIYSSNMLNDFIDTETLNSRAMQARLKATRNTYALGWFRGRDGEVHCAIDQEPMKSRYVHGKPYSEALAGPLQAHETFYEV